MDTNGNIRNLFLPYNLALLAKEKGFDEPCFAHYTEDTKLLMGCKDEQQYRVFGFSTYRNSEGNAISSPLYQQIIDWFREEHNIVIEISEWSKKYSCKIKPFGKSVLLQYEKFDEYYEALNIIIEEAFKLI